MKRTAKHAPGSLVFDRRRGQWQYFWYESGHRRSKTLGGRDLYPTKASAWRTVENWRRPAPAPEDGPTVRKVVKGFLKKKASKRHSTRLSVRSWLRNHILPKWGGSGLLKDVQPRLVQRWLDSITGLSPKSRGHIHDCLRQLWKFAMYAGWVEAAVNPTTFVVVKGRSKRKKRPRSLTIEDFPRFLEQLGGSPIVKMIAIVCASFGLRISEALALRWRNLDPKRGMLVIERAIVRQVEDEVKTEYSGRPMPVDQFLLAALLEWKQTSQFSGVDDWIFASPFRIGRNPLSYPQVWKVFQRAAHSAGLDGFGTHTLRHSYRSWLDSIGTQLSVQQKLMRHADIRTTMNVYGDVVTKQESEALAQISSFTLGKQHATARTIN